MEELDQEDPDFQEAVGDSQDWRNATWRQNFFERNNINFTPEQLRVLGTFGTQDYKGHIKGHADNPIAESIIENLRRVPGKEDKAPITKLLKFHERATKDLYEGNWYTTDKGTPNERTAMIPASQVPRFQKIHSTISSDPRVAQGKMINPTDAGGQGSTAVTMQNIPQIKYKHPLDTYQDFRNRINPFLAKAYEKVSWTPKVHGKQLVMNDNDEINMRDLWDEVHGNKRAGAIKGFFGGQDEIKEDPSRFLSPEFMSKFGLDTGQAIKMKDLRDYFYQHHGGPNRSFELMEPYLARSLVHNKHYRYAGDFLRTVNKHFKDVAELEKLGQIDLSRRDLQIAPHYTASRMLNSLANPARATGSYDPNRYFKYDKNAGRSQVAVNNDNFTPMGDETTWQEQLERANALGGQQYFWNHSSEFH